MSRVAPTFGILRQPLKWILVINLVFLPITFFPCVNGTIEAFLFVVRAAKEPSLFQQHYTQQVDRRRMLDYYSVPGAPSILDIALPPFNIIEIRHPTQWWQRIGLTRFTAYHDGQEPVRQLARLNNLYRTVRFHERGKPWHHFLYIADGFVSGDETALHSAWDRAFGEILKHHYLHPAVGNAEFTWLSPVHHFLADVWHIKGPALVHFTTETPSVHLHHEALEADLASRPSVFRSVPVTVRVIEFPNTKAQAQLGMEVVAQTIMPGRFPSMYEQILAVTGSTDNWELYHPYDHFNQAMRRFNEYCDNLEKMYPLAFGWLARAEDVMGKWLESDDAPWVSLIHLLAFSISLIPFSLISNFATAVWILSNSWVGLGMEDKVRMKMAKLQDLKAAGVPEPEPNLMADMLGGFIGSLGEGFQKIVDENEEAKLLVDKMWKTVREGSKPVEVKDHGAEKQQE